MTIPTRRSALASIAALALTIPLAIRARTTSRERRLVFVGDTRHYFQVEHARVLSALGQGFSEEYGVRIETRHIDYENPAILAALSRELADSQPDILAIAGDDEARDIHAAVPTTPLVFYVTHDPSALGLTESNRVSGANATGYFSDDLEHVRPVSILREILVDRGSLNVAIAAAPQWFSAARMNFWNTVAKDCDVRLHAVPSANFESLENNAAWQNAGDYDGWIVPLSKASVTKKPMIVEHLNRCRVLSIFERFTATRIGAPLAYAHTSLYWYEYFAQSLRLVAAGISPSQIPVRNPDAWRYAANLAALNAVGVRLPPNVVALIDEAF